MLKFLSYIYCVKHLIITYMKLRDLLCFNSQIEELILSNMSVKDMLDIDLQIVTSRRNGFPRDCVVTGLDFFVPGQTFHIYIK